MQTKKLRTESNASLAQSMRILGLKPSFLSKSKPTQQLQQQIKEISFEKMRPRIEVPYMYSNLNLDPQEKAKTSGDSSETEENTTEDDQKQFIKFVLVGNQPKNPSASANTQTQSEETNGNDEDNSSFSIRRNLQMMNNDDQEESGLPPNAQTGPRLSRFDQSQQSTQQPQQSENQSRGQNLSQNTPVTTGMSSSLAQQGIADSNGLHNLPVSSFESPAIPQRQGARQGEQMSDYLPLPCNFNQISEVIVLGDFIVARLERGICFAFNRYTKETLILNKNKRETIKSTFLNLVNNSIFIVSVKQNANTPYLSSMQCRSVSLKNLEEGDTQGQRLFGNFTLQYPDFVEVDDLNRKVVTKHSQDKCFRVWDLGTYEMLYVLRHDYLYEFKICNGVMLLMFDQVENSMPMTILNVHTGKPIMNFCYQKQDDLEYEFLEQYNEKILIKYRDKPLKIHDVLTNKSSSVKNFETPEAFIFVYEKELFLSLKDGKIRLYSINGDLISDFGSQSVYSQECEPSSMNQDEAAKKFYQLSLSDSRNKILTVVKERYLEPEELSTQASKEHLESEQQQDRDIYSEYNRPQKRQKTSDTTFKQCQKQDQKSSLSIPQGRNVFINVIDIKKGQIIAKINPFKIDSIQADVPLKSSRLTSECSIRAQIQEQTQVIQDNFQDKKRKHHLQSDPTGSMSLLHSQQKVHMNQQRYVKLMEEISVVYYDEQRHEIITGHCNGSLCVWK